MNLKSSLRKIPRFVSQALTANNLGRIQFAEHKIDPAKITSPYAGDVRGTALQSVPLRDAGHNARYARRNTPWTS